MQFNFSKRKQKPWISHGSHKNVFFRVLLWFFPIAQKLVAVDQNYVLIRIYIEVYHQQQNKWHPQRCLLAHFEATLDFSRSEFNCPYINITISYYGQVNSLRLKASVATKWATKHLWVTLILLLIVHHISKNKIWPQTTILQNFLSFHVSAFSFSSVSSSAAVLRTTFSRIFSVRFVFVGGALTCFVASYFNTQVGLATVTWEQHTWLDFNNRPTHFFRFATLLTSYVLINLWTFGV